MSNYLKYILFRQKEIARLLEKTVFKVVIIRNILSNIHIFNSYFVDKIRNLSTNKAYEKSHLVL